MAAKENIADIYRLSPIQQGLLFHCLKADNSSVYVEQFAQDLNGRVKADLFDQAWQLAIQTHTILRTGFIWQGVDHPVQVVFKAVNFTLDVHDFSAMTSEQYDSAVKELQNQALNRSFELKKPPLMAFALIHCPDGNSRVVWTYHHLVLDGWSAFLVLEQVLTLYGRLENNETVSVPKVPGYKQFVLWQKSQDQQKAKDYWHQQLGDFSAPTPLGLPATLQNQPRASAAGDYQTLNFTLTAELGSALAQLAQQQHITVSTVLQAAWAYWLSISSREDDVVFGLTLSGRSAELPGSENIAGLLINTLPCRVSLPAADITLAQWLSELQQQFVKLRQFEYSALTDIRSCTQVTQDVDLFNSMLAIETFPYSDVQLADIEVSQQTNYQLTLVIEPAGDYRVRMMFDRNHFSNEVISNVFEQYQQILCQIGEKIAQPVSCLSLLSPAEKNRQDHWNATQCPQPQYSLSERFVAQAKQTPEAIALVVGEQRLSYHQLDQQSNQLAHYLLGVTDRGSFVGQSIAMLFEPSVAQIVVIVAIVKLGAAYVPIDSSLPSARAQEMITRLDLALLLSHRQLAATMVLDDLMVIDTDHQADDINHCSTATVVTPLAENDLLYVVHTSGSTGIPKAAGVYHHSFVNLIDWWNSHYGFNVDDKNLLINKVSFDLAQKNIWGSLLTGGEQHLFDALQFDPQAIVNLIERQQISWINCTPSMGYAMVDACDGDFGALASMRYLLLGGEPVNKARIAPWVLSDEAQVAIVNTYGPTECTDLCSTHDFERDEFANLEQLVTVGRVLPCNIHLHVFDRFDNPLPKGVAGEVMIGGLSIGSGYLNNRLQSEEKFIHDFIHQTSSQRLYRTGDLGYFRDDGTLIVKGRVDFQVKLRGNRVELEEIDVKIRELPQIEDAVTVLSDDGEQLFSYVVLDQCSGNSATALQQTAEQAQADTSTQFDGNGDSWCLRGEQIAPSHDSFIARFEAIASEQSDHPAVQDVALTSSYAQLNRQANQWARYYLEAGLQPGDLVGVYLGRSTALIVQVLALMKIGVGFMPMDDQYPQDRLSYMLNHSGIKNVIIDAATPPQWLAKYSAVRCFGLADDTVQQQAGQLSGANIEGQIRARAAGTPCYIIYTSGSTGEPKGIAVGQQSLVLMAEGLKQSWQLDQQSRILQFSPISFDAFIFELCGALLNGGVLCLLSAQAREPGEQLVEEANILRASHAVIPPSVLNFMTPQSLPLLQHFMVAGEPCSLKLAQQWSQDRTFYNAYGVSESTVISCLSVFQPGDEKLTIGQPVADTLLYILDETLKPVADGMAGELFIGGDLLSLGYLNNPQLTDERFLPDPFIGADDGRMYRTGDWVRCLSDGNIEFVNRLDHQVKVNGFRLELGEYEARINQTQGVAEAVVVAKDIMAGNKKLLAFVIASTTSHDGELARTSERQLKQSIMDDLSATMPVLPADIQFLSSWPRTPNNKIDRAALVNDHGLTQALAVQARDEIRSHLKATLPSYMMPSAFVFLDAMPLNSNGKVDRSALPEIEQGDGQVQGELLAPRNDTEQQLLSIWQEVLKNDVMSITDNFFELGGHSLSITQILSRINKHWSLSISLAKLFDHLSIQSQAELIEQTRAQTDESSAQQGIAFKMQPRPEQLPLSYSQSRLWFLQQFENLGGVYNIPNVIIFDHLVDTASMQQAIDALVQRHESLRTRFVEIDEQAVQQIDADMACLLRVKDIRHLDEGRQADVLRRAATEAALMTFELGTGPLISFSLLQSQDDRGLLFFTAHHMITDGWSGDILIKELQQFYAAHRQQQPLLLPPLAVQFADYSLWQRQQMADGCFDPQLQYWQDRLAGSSATLNLPYDKARPASVSHRGALVQQQLPAQLSQHLNDYARAQQVTGFMLLKAIFDVLLCRWSGQYDFNVGTPVANRHHQEFEPVVGFFVNTLVLRSQHQPQWHFEQLLQQVKQDATAAFDHQDVPFEYLVEKLNPERDSAFNPLFQVMFTLQTAQGNTSIVSPEQWIAHFDLQLIAVQQADGLFLTWEFNRDLFDRATIELLAESFRHLAGQIVSGQAASEVSQLSILPPKTRDGISKAEQGPQSDWPFTDVMAAFDHQVATRGEATALLMAQTTMTYAELDRQVSVLTTQLLAVAGSPVAGSTQVIATCLERSTTLVVAVLAVMRAGYGFLNLDPTYPLDRLNNNLADAQSHCLITSAALQDTLGLQNSNSSNKTLLVDSLDLLDFDGTVNSDVLPLNTDSLAYLIYTSGSTGKPKAVVIHHDGLINTLMATAKRWSLGPDAVMLQFASAGFDAFVLEMGCALVSGAALCLTDSASQKDPQVLAKVIESHQVTHCIVPPSLLNFMPQAACDSITHLMVGGEACPYDIAKQWSQGRVFLNAYGPSEVSIVASISEFDSQQGQIDIGYPLDNVQCYVLDSHQQVCPIGVTGELYIGGAGISPGYLARETLNAEVFLTIAINGQPTQVYRSGDYVRRNRDGALVFAGRHDGQFKLRGLRIEAGEIEYQLGSIDGIKDALVMKQQGASGENLVAWVIGEPKLLVNVTDEPLAFTADQLAQIKQTLSQQLPAFMVPAVITPLLRWPLTPNGKVDKALLQKRVFVSSVTFVAPKSAIQVSLAQTWHNLLGRQNIGLNDDFFELGGHSLLATQMMARVHQQYDVSLPLRDFFMRPTIAYLAQTLTLRLSGDQGSSLRIESDPIDWALDGAVTLAQPLPPMAADIEGILLTGSTGFVGAYLIQECLIRWPQATLYCHVRADSEAQGLVRITDNLKRYGLTIADTSQIKPVLGDLAKPDIGVAAPLWQQLAQSVDLVIHNGAILNHMADYDSLKAANLDSTKSLIEFAAQQRLKRLVLVSTLGLFHMDQQKRTVDEFIDSKGELHRKENGYNGSKWVAELAVLNAIEQGLPASIMRLGRVAIDSQSGAGKADDLVGLYLRTQIQSGKLPRYKFNERVVPADYAAKAIVAIAAIAECEQEQSVFHLYGQDNYNWSKLLGKYVNTNGQFETLSIKIWVDTVKRMSQNQALPFAPYLFYLDTDNEAPDDSLTTLSDGATVKVLEQMGVNYPSISDQAWQNYIRSLFDHEGIRFEFKKRRFWQ